MLGGEEFIMVLACDRASAAVETAGAVLDAVLHRDIPHQSRTDQLRRVSVSIGVAFSRDVAADGLSDFLQAADLALYQAKSAGRNQVVSYSPEFLGTSLAEFAPKAAPSALRGGPRGAVYGI